MKAATQFAIALLLSSMICPAELTPEEKKRASTLYKEFKASTDDLAARTAVVSQMLEMGTPVAKVIHPIIDREFRAATERYRTGFENQTKTVANSKDSREKRDRVKKLRASIQALRQIKDLKKEAIVEVGDPAISQLRKLTKLDRQEVLTSSGSLSDARTDLVELGKQRNACLDALLLVEIDPFQPEALATEETQIASAALGVDRDARKILSQNEKLASEVEPAEAEAIRDLNEWRMLVGLGPCLIDPKLCAASRGHSKDMKEKGFFAHDSPISGKEDPWKRAKLEGTSANSENIFVGNKNGADANRAWWHSPGHHKNMLAPGMRRVGMGLYGSHWTQMFGR